MVALLFLPEFASVVSFVTFVSLSALFLPNFSFYFRKIPAFPSKVCSTVFVHETQIRRLLTTHTFYRAHHDIYAVPIRYLQLPASTSIMPDLPRRIPRKPAMVRPINAKASLICAVSTLASTTSETTTICECL